MQAAHTSSESLKRVTFDETAKRTTRAHTIVQRGETVAAWGPKGKRVVCLVTVDRIYYGWRGFDTIHVEDWNRKRLAYWNGEKFINIPRTRRPL